MEEENHNHGHDHHRQSEEEAVLRDAAANAAEDGAQQHALPMQEEDGGAGADRLDLDLDDATAQDEAMAHALYMEELMQVEDWDLHRFELVEPAGAVGPFAFHAPPAEQAGAAGGFHHQFFAAGPPPVFDGSPAAGAGAQANANVVLLAPGGGGADMQELADHAAAVENPQLFAAAGQANANNNNQPAAGQPRGSVLTRLAHASTSRGRGGGGPRAFNQTAARGESVTIRLQTRSSADAVVSARQAVLGGADSRVVLAGMEEEHDDSWYESLLHEAQILEQIEEDGDPGHYQVVSFRTQLPTSPQHEPPTEDDGSSVGSDPSDLDPDEPGPSTARRVPPLGDDEVPQFICGICMETLPILDLFHGMQCDHRFCVECMATYIEGRVHAGEVPVPCPDLSCKAKDAGEEDDDNGRRLSLHPEECKKSIDFAAFGSWGDRLTENAIPQSRRAYCPNRRCGVMLEATGGKTPALAFCPACGHPMCATCGLDWSKDDSGQHDCTEGPSATLVKKLAEERRWKQCPMCKMVVERTYGCNVMRCRCQFVFCYACGLPTGRQTGMEEGAELCHCQSTVQAAQIHHDWLA
ncbi:unnamed protein product [Urochloa decumbens]|uniref:RBR-type E3 ubiquitin transferase n=1 Tax=Urochloa decumbens TaxID=240449 RepID=A0ABC9G856_9POAL